MGSPPLLAFAGLSAETLDQLNQVGWFLPFFSLVLPVSLILFLALSQPIYFVLLCVQGTALYLGLRAFVTHLRRHGFTSFQVKIMMGPMYPRRLFHHQHLHPRRLRSLPPLDLISTHLLPSALEVVFPNLPESPHPRRPERSADIPVRRPNPPRSASPGRPSFKRRRPVTSQRYLLPQPRSPRLPSLPRPGNDFGSDAPNPTPHLRIAS